MFNQNELTFIEMSGILSYMKTVNARAFQKEFSKVAQELSCGETVAVTRRGKPLGFFTKAPERSPGRMPDFAANLFNLPPIGSKGEKIMAETLDEPVS